MGGHHVHVLSTIPSQSKIKMHRISPSLLGLSYRAFGFSSGIGTGASWKLLAFLAVRSYPCQIHADKQFATTVLMPSLYRAWSTEMILVDKNCRGVEAGGLQLSAQLYTLVEEPPGTLGIVVHVTMLFIPDISNLSHGQPTDLPSPPVGNFQYESEYAGILPL
jgi:hypothetical protein